MRKIILLLVLATGFAYCQVYEEVVYLKDGSIIHGRIIEFAPDKHIKIQSGRNVFVYQLQEIEKITREPYQELHSDLSMATWTTQLGIGTPRSLNLIGITKDFKMGEKGSLFITTGLGINLIGVGYARQKNYNGNGLVLSGTLGHNGGGPTLSAAITHQWRISNHGFFSAGLMAGSFTTDEGDGSLVFPTLSFDLRY